MNGLLRGVLLALIGLLSGCGSIGQRFVFPGAATQGKPETKLHPGERYELLSLQTRQGIHIAAVFGQALDSRGQRLADSQHCPTLIFFYGNGAYLNSCGVMFERFRRIGMNVLIPEYPGYGMSEGRPSEQGCYAAADAAYEYLLDREKLPPAQIIVAGQSLGAAVALDLASRCAVGGLVTISAFTKTRDVGVAVSPWIVRWAAPAVLHRCKFDNLEKVSSVSCPILIIHGTADTLVPPEMADRLAGKAKGAVTRLPVQGANHNDIWWVGGDRLYQTMADWARSGGKNY